MVSNRQQKRWKDLTVGEQSTAIIGVGLQLTLLGSALWDISHRPDAEIRGRRGLWTAALFVNFVGPIAYFMWGRERP